MKIFWAAKALGDLERLFDFLAAVNPKAAARSIQKLAIAPRRLARHPRMGERLEEFDPREVRRIFVAHYEMRYEIRDDAIYVLRIWHAREDR